MNAEEGIKKKDVSIYLCLCPDSRVRQLRYAGSAVGFELVTGLTKVLNGLQAKLSTLEAHMKPSKRKRKDAPSEQQEQYEKFQDKVYAKACEPSSPFFLRIRSPSYIVHLVHEQVSQVKEAINNIEKNVFQERFRDTFYRIRYVPSTRLSK